MLDPSRHIARRKRRGFRPPRLIAGVNINHPFRGDLYAPQPRRFQDMRLPIGGDALRRCPLMNSSRICADFIR